MTTIQLDDDNIIILNSIISINKTGLRIVIMLSNGIWYTLYFDTEEDLLLYYEDLGYILGAENEYDLPKVKQISVSTS